MPKGISSAPHAPPGEHGHPRPARVRGETSELAAAVHVPPPTLIERTLPQPAALRAELLAGLQQPQARIAPKFLYDALGARLFAAITALPEYYPPRAEAAIFAAHLPAIREALGTPGRVLFDLGAGNGEKAGALLAALAPRAYVALDFAAAGLAATLATLQRQYPDVPMYGVAADFTRGLDLPAPVPTARPLFFYPGSSIGNFAPAAAETFLRALHAIGAGDAGSAADRALLIGVDLDKDPAILLAAYDDALGVTAAFNRNLLRHVNALAGTDFDVRDWQHRAGYAAPAPRIAMHLEARRAVTVRWAGGARRFAAGERIHTEDSYKYRAADFAALLARAGWPQVQQWTDPDAAFAVYVARNTVGGAAAPAAAPAPAPVTPPAGRKLVQ